jgi:AcrR family transcriptional regulator
MNKNRQPQLEKKDIYWQVLNAAISLDIKKGSLKWSMTDLAKNSKVSRTLIYYYFGKSKEGILLEAIDLFGQELSGSTPERMAAWKAGRIAETLLATRDLMNLSPSIRIFYHLNKEKDTDVGLRIRDFEKKLFKKIGAFFPQLKKADHEGLFALILGIALTPHLSAEAIERAVHMILHGVKR